MPTTSSLDERLRAIAAALTGEIARIVCRAIVDELSTLSAGSDVHAVETRAKKPRPKTRMKSGQHGRCYVVVKQG